MFDCLSACETTAYSTRAGVSKLTKQSAGKWTGALVRAVDSDEATSPCRYSRDPRSGRCAGGRLCDAGGVPSEVGKSRCGVGEEAQNIHIDTLQMSAVGLSGLFGKKLHSILCTVLEHSVCTHGSRDGNPEAPLQPTLLVTLSLPFLQHPGKSSDDLP